MGLLVGRRPFPMTLSPLMRLSGHSRSQETKWCSVSHLLISHPASLRMVIAVMTSRPSIRVRSAPLMRNNPVGKSNRGLLPLFFLSRPLYFSSGRARAAVFRLLEILCEPLIALGHLRLGELITILFLLLATQQIVFAVTLQSPRD